MQGSFDDDLQWPFEGSITIQLLNQIHDSQQCTESFSCTFAGGYVGLHRVTSGERAQHSCGGIHMFLSHTKLDFSGESDCKYLHNNQLKFRVSKATNLDPMYRIQRRCLMLETFTKTIGPNACVVPIEFILSDFERMKKQNAAWVSPAFFTHRKGYRICLDVHPNGIAERRQTHMSIMTCILCGPFDAQLKWPFRGDITIKIVNQAGTENHWEQTNGYTERTPDSCSNRVTDEEKSYPWGFLQFIAHSSLHTSATKTSEYLRRDSLRIRISKVDLKH